MMQETMTRRERVTRAVSHQPVDRMPIDMGCHFSTGISIFAYWNLREYLGLSTDAIELVDCMQLLARVDEDVLDRFHVDTVLLNPPFPKTRRWNPRGKYSFIVPELFTPEQQPDGGWVIHAPHGSARMPAGGFFFDGDFPDLWGISPEARMALYAQRAEKLFKETDRFTMWMGYGAFFDGIDFACDMLTEPEACMALNERRLAEQIAAFDQMNAACGKYIGAIEVNSDLGMQSGPMCSPDSYREVCMPYLKRFCEHVHQTSDIKVFMHSCGAIALLLPSIIEAGVDAINPVQISATGMDPRTLKAAYGDKICFWGGGCDTQHTLDSATPEEVAAQAREMVGIFAPGSGYVFNQVHNIMGNVPPENIVALYDAAYASSFSVGTGIK